MIVFGKKLWLSRYFLAIWEVKALGKVFMRMYVYSVQIIIRLDNQSKFQMFTPFRCRHIGVPKLYTNMAAPYWAL